MMLYFSCKACGRNKRKLTYNSFKYLLCECGENMERVSSPPTTMSTELLDNGAMARPLERLDRAEEIFKERAARDDRGEGKEE